MICPTFAPFEFTSWKLGDEDSFCNISKLMDISKDEDELEAVDEHKFDVNAVPEPICDDMDCDADYGLGKKNVSFCSSHCILYASLSVPFISLGNENIKSI